MKIKTILTPIDDTKETQDVLMAAQEIAKNFGSHINALYVIQGRIRQSMYGLYDLSYQMYEQAEKEFQKRTIKQANALKSQFEKFCNQKKLLITNKPSKDKLPTAEWHNVEGHIQEILIQYSRMNDLIIAPRFRKKSS